MSDGAPPGAPSALCEVGRGGRARWHPQKMKAALLTALAFGLLLAAAPGARAAAPTVRWQLADASLAPAEQTRATLIVTPRTSSPLRAPRACVLAAPGVRLTPLSAHGYRVRVGGEKALCWRRTRVGAAARRSVALRMSIAVTQAAAPDEAPVAAVISDGTRRLASSTAPVRVLAAVSSPYPIPANQLGAGVTHIMSCEDDGYMRTPCSGRRIIVATGIGATPGSLDSITSAANGFAVLSQSVAADGSWTARIAYSCGSSTTAAWTVTFADSGRAFTIPIGCHLAPA